VHPPAESSGPYDRQGLPGAGYVPAHRTGRRRSRAIWLRVEIGKSGPAATPGARRAPAEVTADPTYSDRIRGWIERVLPARLADERDLPATGVNHPSGQEPEAPHAPGFPANRPAAISFWDQLKPYERAALLSVAQWVTFSAGDRLMREGDPADCVIVIFEGQTRVCVDENGWERDLAERGPGQLIGERGGLQVRVRSASVIAIEPVWGLMVTTADFSAFVGRHTRVLDIVEDQLYDRLAEDRPQHQDHSWPGTFSAASTAHEPATVWTDDALTVRQIQPPLSGHNCTVLLTDVVGFGSARRNDEDRRIIREALFGMTHTMLRGVAARSEDRGDGLLTVVPSDVPTAVVMERLVKELPSALAQHNITVRESARFQLRVAINVGPVTTDIMGFNGEAIIITARLIEAPIFKEGMVKTHADVGVIAASFVYDAVIKHSPNPADLVGYSQVGASLKDFTAPAWMKFFSAPPPPYSLSSSAAASYFDWRV
jgi:CRP-like cAMP-binding protein